MERSKRPKPNPPDVTIGAGSMIVATMTDMEEVARIMAIKLVINARAGAEAEAATGSQPQLWENTGKALEL